MSVNQWGSDVPVSMPQALPSGVPGLVDMGGFTMTEFGLFPNLSAADHERLSRPTYAPYDPTVQQVEATVEATADREWT